MAICAVALGAPLLTAETFDTDVIANGFASNTGDWSSPCSQSGNPEWDWQATSACATGSAVFEENFTWDGCFLRSPEIDATGLDEVQMTFDLTNTLYGSESTTAGSDWSIRIYIWIDGGYKAAVPVTINGVSTRRISFTSARSCEEMEVVFDISGIAGVKNDCLLYIETNPVNSAETYYAEVDNIRITETADEACITLPTCGTNPLTATWNGSSSSDWFDCTNWTPNEIPGASTTVTIPTTATDPEIDGTNVTINSLEMDGGALSIINDADLEVSNTLTLTDGIITTAANSEVYLSNTTPGAVDAYTLTSYINGTFRTALGANGAYVLPVGGMAGVTGAQTAIIDFTEVGGFSELTASFNATSPGAFASAPNLAISECGNGVYKQWLGNGYWTIDATGTLSGAEYDLELRPDPVSYTAPGTYSVTACKRPSGDPVSNFAMDGDCNPASTLNTAAPRVYRDGITTGFSDIAVIVDNTTPFPVELLSLSAERQAEHILLNWQTAQETNNAGFSVQRSTRADGGFAAIGWVDGQGNTNKVIDYQLMDRKVVPNQTYFYRLEQQDFDGELNYSNVVSATIDEAAGLALTVYPNPSEGHLDLRWAGDYVPDAAVAYRLIDATGRVVWQRTCDSITACKSLDLSGLADGLYTLEAKHAGNAFTSRVVLQR